MVHLKSVVYGIVGVLGGIRGVFMGLEWNYGGFYRIWLGLYGIMGVSIGIKGVFMGLGWNYGRLYGILWDLVRIKSLLYGIAWDYVQFI